jgi:hypothetical protein
MVVRRRWSARSGFFAAVFQCIDVFWDVTLCRWGQCFVVPSAFRVEGPKKKFG